MRAVTHFSRRNLLRQVSESGLGLPNYNSRPRYIRVLARVEHPGVVSQGHTKASGHPCISDLTAAEMVLLSQGQEVLKNDVLISTHSQSTDGQFNVFVSFKDLNGEEVGNFVVNKMVTCSISRWNKKVDQDAYDALLQAHFLISTNQPFH